MKYFYLKTNQDLEIEIIREMIDRSSRQQQLGFKAWFCSIIWLLILFFFDHNNNYYSCLCMIDSLRADKKASPSIFHLLAKNRKS